MDWLVPVVVAVITGPMVAVINRLRKENSQQHAEGRELINRVLYKVDQVGSKIDGHIGWHEGREK